MRHGVRLYLNIREKEGMRMKILIIYNKSNGKILFTQSINEDIENNTFTNICAEIQDGKVLKSIDTSLTPNVPIYEDIPTSEIDILKQQLKENKELITEYVNNKYNSLLNY
jgi:fructose-bisphosphate aldolase class 1